MIILRETGVKDAAAIAEAIRGVVQESAVETDVAPIHVTASVGVCSQNTEQPLTKDALIEGADRALYRSKLDGRNRVTVWDPRFRFEESGTALL